MSTTTTTKTPQEIEIRKLRKKLRQIETLERLDRDLSEEEAVKVLKKDAIREQLQKLLIAEAEKQANLEAIQAQEASAGEVEEQQLEEHDEEEDVDAESESIGEPEVDDVKSIEDLPPSYNEVCEQIPEEKPKEKSPSPKKVKEEKSVSKEPKSSAVPKVEDPVKKEAAKRKQIKKAWNRSQFLVYDLEGHNDLVTGIDSNEEILITASRDTTLRSWSLKNFEELHIFGGHSEGVTSVKLLNADESKKIGESMFADTSKSLYMVSGSFDCTFKIWQIETGKMMKSVYTYNPVTQLAYFAEEEIFLTASDGGKLEVWSAKSAENIYSERIFDEAITGLQVEDGHIYSSSSEGVLKVLQWRNKKLACLYKSEDLRMADMRPISQRQVRCIGVFNNRIYYGDDGINIKVVDWKKGVVDKLLNHTEDFGVTDAACCNKDSLFTSAYDIDNGLAYINVRTLPDTEYVGTLNDESTGQIKCIHSCRGSISTGNLMIAIGGLELKIWKLIASSKIPEDLCVVPARYLPKLSMIGPDSGTESDFTEDEDEEEEEEEYEEESEEEDLNNSNSGWLSSCTII